MFNYAESVASRNTYMASIREAMAEAPKPKPAVTITIDGDPESSKSHKFYATADRIEGSVSIVASADTRFDDIHITFEGTSRTWMEQFSSSPAISGRSTVTQTFVHLTQPIDESTLPIPRIAIKGQAYTFPFTFVIPDRLLPSSCTHNVENQAVRDAHQRLPPSFGDPSIFSHDDKDDQAPDMTRISYGIRVRIIRKRETDNKPLVLVDTIRKIAVSPSIEDLPPAIIEDRSREYVLRKEKDMRKGLLGKKLGRISIFADQPQPLHLAPNCPCPASTSVPVYLTFVADLPEIPPPELVNLTAKIVTSTFFSTMRTAYIPTASRSTPDPSIGNYTETTLLSSRSIGNVGWEKQQQQSSSRKPMYKAQLAVPIAAPKGKHLVPSFSTCHVTRSYILNISVSARASSHSQPSLTLKLPLQVSQPATEELVGYVNIDNGVEEFFTPRFTTPSTIVQESSIMPLPPAFEEERGEGEVPRRRAVQLPPSMLVHPPNQLPPPGYSVFGNVRAWPARIPEPVGISPGCG